jgi:5-methylcytosine-specific restriction endonuclease McrA
VKQGKPLKRSPLRRTKPSLRRSKRLKPRSDKTARLYREQRVPFVTKMLAERPVCQIKVEGVCTGASVDLHEPKMRSRGGSIVDPENAVATCRPCHSWLHAHPAEATKLGWLKSRYSV